MFQNLFLASPIILIVSFLPIIEILRWKRIISLISRVVETICCRTFFSRPFRKTCIINQVKSYSIQGRLQPDFPTGKKLEDTQIATPEQQDLVSAKSNDLSIQQCVFNPDNSGFEVPETTGCWFMIWAVLVYSCHAPVCDLAQLWSLTGNSEQGGPWVLLKILFLHKTSKI